MRVSQVVSVDGRFNTYGKKDYKGKGKKKEVRKGEDFAKILADCTRNQARVKGD